MSERPNTRLNSWKEIADYLDREVRTVARWEKEFGLPVQRVGGGKGRSVFAYTADIDEWLARTKLNGETPPYPIDDDRSATRTVAFKAVPRWVLLAASVAVAGTLLLWTRGLADPAVANVHVSGGLLTAYTANAQPLWTATFEDTTVNPQPLPIDLDGNGINEVVAFSRGVGQTYEQPPRGAALSAFSGSGRSLWTFKPGDISLRFGDETYGGPWPGQTWQATQTPSGPLFALGIHHYTWWPGLVITLDRSGKVLGQFVNSGWVTSLASIKRDSEPLLLAGGISNSNDSAMLAILNFNNPTGSSPEKTDSKYQCRSCSVDGPLGYLVFPRSELNRSSISRYNQVVAIDSFPDRVLVHVQEVDRTAIETYSLMEAIYEFTPEMQIRGFRFSDQYWDFHRHLELEGKLKHSAIDCPERTRPHLIRSWSPSSGWRDISVPPL
jgi:hypothetical protein